ncbi:Glyoxalase family protein [Collimonas arenae]|uniref:Glyoxalase family protein n=1 Tax=Collimonas arenae TaxID=279058 RepID=A0A0A1F9K4_9BURK|nr:extradiol dioxygenase [Collimonas arenae]AIY41191.1 Glyoxalase family protein [Collimonas arenae]
MHKQIYVNLPVKDLQKSMAFFQSLGYTFNAKFTNDQAACMELGENLYVMLLVEKFFQSFAKKPISDATRQTEVLLCVSCDSRAHVDKLVALACASGAEKMKEALDYGFMYSDSFHDLDGHAWEMMYMEPEAAGQATSPSTQDDVKA